MRRRFLALPVLALFGLTLAATDSGAAAKRTPCLEWEEYAGNPTSVPANTSNPASYYGFIKNVSGGTIVVTATVYDGGSITKDSPDFTGASNPFTLLGPDEMLDVAAQYNTGTAGTGIIGIAFSASCGGADGADTLTVY